MIKKALKQMKSNGSLVTLVEIVLTMLAFVAALNQQFEVAIIWLAAAIVVITLVGGKKQLSNNNCLER